MALPTSGMMFHYSAQVLTSLDKSGGGTPANNDPIRTWNDLSGLGYTLDSTDGAKMPLYQTGVINSVGHGLLFDGTNDYMKTTGTFINYDNSAVTVAVVFIPKRIPAVGTEVETLLATKFAGTPHLGWGVDSGNWYNPSLTYYNVFDSEYGTTNIVGTEYVSCLASRVDMRLILDQPYFALATFPAHTHTTGPLFLGCFDNTGASLAFYGRNIIAECASWKRVLTAAEIADVKTTWETQYNFGTIIRPQIDATANDAQQRIGAFAPSITGNPIQLGNAASGQPQVDGWRWALSIPKGSTVTKAYVRFIAQAANTSATPTLTIYAQAVNDATAFSTAVNNVGSRASTTATVAWTGLPSWVSGLEYITPNIGTVVDEIVKRAGWASGNNIAILISATNVNVLRPVVSYDGASANAAYLEVYYKSLGPNWSPGIINSKRRLLKR